MPLVPSIAHSPLRFPSDLISSSILSGCVLVPLDENSLISSLGISLFFPYTLSRKAELLKTMSLTLMKRLRASEVEKGTDEVICTLRLSGRCQLASAPAMRTSLTVMLSLKVSLIVFRSCVWLAIRDGTVLSPVSALLTMFPISGWLQESASIVTISIIRLFIFTDTDFFSIPAELCYSHAMAKLWQKDYTLDSLMQDFTVRNDYILDLRLVNADVLGSLAHAMGLEKAGILTHEEVSRLKEALLEILSLNEKGGFEIRAEDEDCHTAIEGYLCRRIGDAGKKIHTGRSRNDQVQTALRLYMKDAVLVLASEALSFARELTEQAVKGEKIPMPGRTHTQLAMPSSLGLWFSSYSSELADEVELLLDFYSLIDQCPLGSAASYGVPLPLDRKYTAGLLGFSRVQKNVLYANNSRGKFEAVLLDICSYMSATACKLAQDLILFTLPELGYFSLPAELTTGSSIMPQKKNPDGLELVRSRSALVQAQSTLVKDITRSLVSGYNRDFQDTKEPLMTGVDTTHQILAIMSRMTGRLVIHEDRLREGMRSEIYATDKVFEKVREGGTFRDSYKDVGLNLDKVDAEDADEAIAKRTSYGTSGCLCLDEDFARISAMEADVRAKREKTDSAVRALTGQSVNLCGLS